MRFLTSPFCVSLIASMILFTGVSHSSAREICLHLFTSSANQRGAFQRQDARSLMNVAETTEFHLEPQMGVVEAYKKLQQKKALITQDEFLLPVDCTGGTCASIATSNTLLAGMESFHPGSISGMNLISKKILHLKLISTFRDLFREKFNHDFTKGAALNEIAEIVNEAMRRIFKANAVPVHVYVENAEPQTFQSLDLAKNSILVLGLGRAEENKSHAVVGLGVVHHRAEDSYFKIQISDPHKPEISVELAALESDWKIFFPAYLLSRSSKNQSVELIDGKTPPVHSFIVFSFGNRPPSKIWNWDVMQKQFPEFFEESAYLKARFTVTLKSGSVFRNLSVFPPTHITGASVVLDGHPNEYLRFFNSEILQSSLKFDDIAHIEMTLSNHNP